MACHIMLLLMTKVQFCYVYSRIMAHSVTKNKIETTLKKILVYYFSVTE